MGIVMGYICLVFFLLLIGIWVSKRMKNQKISHYLVKVHKTVGFLFLVTCCAHLILVLPVIETRNLWVTVSGVVGFGITILLILLCHVQKDYRKKMRFHRMLTVCLTVAILFHMVAYFADFLEYQNNIRGIELENVNISTVADGEYVGEYDAGYIYAKVKVTVLDGQITQIELLEHNNERGQKAESVIDRIVDEQELDVDGVSGATNSSLVIQKACENALIQNGN